MGCLFIEEAGDRLVYDCWLIDYDIKVSVPFPKRVVQLWAATEGRDPRDFRTERVKTCEMFIYALAKLDRLPQDVQNHLTKRLGPYLKAAREYATSAWKNTETFDVSSWAGS